MAKGNGGRFEPGHGSTGRKQPDGRLHHLSGDESGAVARGSFFAPCRIALLRATTPKGIGRGYHEGEDNRYLGIIPVAP